mgnify:FL=1
MMDTQALKNDVRKKIFAKRKLAHKARNTSETLFLSSFLRDFRGHSVAGYMPIRTEIDPLPAMTEMSFYGKVGVPVIQGMNKPLLIAEWTPSTEMIEGQFGAQVPVSKNFFDPELLIVPLVAFDRQGGRLGYGGGFYDRTLEKLKMKKPVLAVGFAYSCQEIEQVPLEMTDQRLDFVITEKAVLDLRSQP